MIFQVILVLAAAASGAIASLAGFGIGSILTPLLATQVGTKLAVAAVSFPHFAGTALRFSLMRRKLNRRVLLIFGTTSAASGLTGAWLHTRLQSTPLGYVLAGLLIFAGLTGASGIASRMRFGRFTGLVAGGLSGAFGGLVGNQGGIRSAALMGFDLDKEAFVATATAIGLVVDVFRMPFYVASQQHDILRHWGLIAGATVGVVVGTLLGRPLLRSVPDRTFRRTVYALVLCLGVAMLLHPGGHS